MTEEIPKDDRRHHAEIIGWIGLADHDYLGARVLINNALLLQGAILSCTAIEKYLKMIHKIRGWTYPYRNHDLIDLNNRAKLNGLDLKLNENYLSLLTKLYKMRYPDAVEADFNYAINQAKLLVGLDETVYAIRHRLQIINADPDKKRESQFEHWISSNYNHLTRMNHAYCPEVKRELLFQNPSVWNEQRFVGGKAWMEAGYTANVKDDGVYDLPGLVPGENDRQFKFQEAPMDLQNK